MDPVSPLSKSADNNHIHADLDQALFQAPALSQRVAAIIEHTKLHGPKALRNLNLKLGLVEAEEICSVLKDSGIKLQPYDFHSTDGVWRGTNTVPYRSLALRELMSTLATEQGVDYRTIAGFKTILPRLSGETVYSRPINQWGTTLNGMIDSYYAGSVPRAVLDFLRHDPEMCAIREVGIEENDLPVVPRRYWLNPDNTPSDNARKVTHRALKILCGRSRDPQSKEGFAWVLENVTQKSFRQVEISPWGANPEGMTMQAYNGSHVQAIMDLVESDPRYRGIKKIGVNPFNFKRSPNGTLTVRKTDPLSGEEILTPTHEARSAVRILIESLAKANGVSAYTVSGFKVILPLATRETCESIRLTEWKTPLRSVLRSAYQNSIARAICDLVENDSRFLLIKRAELSGIDFSKVPKGTWRDATGAVTDNARKVARLGIEVYAKELGVSPYSLEGFLKVGTELTIRKFRGLEVNQWGTTPGSMLKVAYNDKLKLMFLDLLENDGNFKALSRESVE